VEVTEKMETITKTEGGVLLLDTDIPTVQIRPYKESDLEEVIKVYQSAFAEPPWDEYQKCTSCGVEYGIKESETAGPDCKKCESPLELVEFWSPEDIKGDLEFAKAQKDPIVLVAENGTGLVGFSWGYQIPFDKFKFIEGKVDPKTSYMDEIAVSGNRREKGVGRLLGRAYLAATEAQDMKEVALRTDQRNIASMTLFQRLGFKRIPDPTSQRGTLYDPEFPDRVYLRTKLK
jgi:ribosomal protein S18 acetylase RimI-like enzyme